MKLGGGITIMQGDNRARLKEFPDASFDSCVCDPPYELGFMGKAWDKSGIAYDVTMWKEVYRVLKPGAHLLAFGGSRTYHRLACAIEDAGFVIRDQIMWLYGSGFPKSLDVSKAMDKAAGSYEPGEVLPTSRQVEGPGGYHMKEKRGANPQSALAHQWDGWGTALKPAHEPIVVARKPLIEKEIDILQAIVILLKQNGVEGEIRWTKPVKTAEKQRTKKNFTQTNQQQMEETSAGPVREKEMVPTETGTGNLYANSPEIGKPITQDGEKNTTLKVQRNCENKCLPHTAINVPVVENPGRNFSRLTMLMGEEVPTASGLETPKSMPNCVEKDFPKTDTDSFAGIATVPSVSTDTVLTVIFEGINYPIKKNPDGLFIWPESLPKFRPAKTLTVVTNVLKHGTGAINVAGCRIEGPEPHHNYGRTSGEKSFCGEGPVSITPQDGRWPANVIHDGSDEVLACFPETSSGAIKQGTPYNHSNCKTMGAAAGVVQSDFPASRGSAARFFYCAKASPKERNLGLEALPDKEIPYSEYRENFDTTKSIVSEYADGSPRPMNKQKNSHPTVKPLTLMAYLVRLVTPPGGLVLDPFMGSGSTLIAAAKEGFCAVGIELEAENCEIAERRCHGHLGMLAEVANAWP